MPDKTYKCELCRKEIKWDEFCVNFGWCDGCFNISVEKYFEKRILDGKIYLR